ncbi:unnamed protein product, partial [Mesorhabditis belari]|uniref:Integrase catalytic domain-containing protein n=1 Tax=Mesorhabditis belari TaxID=2138241 RepID=A0AAF3FLH8_9BILA
MTDNGREFANKLLEEAVAQWAGCKILHGKPRHSQSQGSVERANADIEDILSVHQRETKTTEWARFLPLIQYRKNIRFHSVVLRNFLNSQIWGIMTPTFNLGLLVQCLGVQKDEEQAAIDCLHDLIMMERHGAHSAQKNQARKMLRASEQRFAPIDVEQNVLMPIPCVDRPKIGPRNLMGVVTAVTNGFYSIGTQNGHLRQTFTRNQLAPCGAEFFSINSISDWETSLRTAVGAASISGSQAKVTLIACA